MYTRIKLALFVSVLALAGTACTPSASPTETPTVAVTETAEPAPEGEACLIGSWHLDNDSYLEFLQALAAASSAAGAITFDSVDGAALVTFSDDGTVSHILDGFTFTACPGAVCNTYEVPTSAATTFSYTAASGVITFDGGQIVAANFGEFEGSELFGETATYTCSGNTLSTQYGDLPTILWERVP